MSTKDHILSYFQKVAAGSVPADGEVMVKRAINEGLISRQDAASHFGVQAGQVIQKSKNLKPRDVKGFCSKILTRNSPA